MNNRFLALFVTLFVISMPIAAHAETLSLHVDHITMVTAPPTCEAHATKTVITSGKSTSIVWKSKNADAMIGMTQGETVWETKGRQRFSIGIPGKHEFPLTFTGAGGSTTCIVKVFVHPKKASKR